MTLTEQLYEGTLPTGWYYFNNGVETYIVLYSNANTKDRKLQEPSGLTVLGEVPSYEEYIALQSDSLAKNEGAEIVAELDGRLKKTQKLELGLRREKIKKDTEIKMLYDQLEVKNNLLKAYQEAASVFGRKLLQAKPELREWLEKHYGEYL
jgi:hypothetical protein